MPLRAVLRYLLNNEQLIQKMAESYPIRRAAQLTAYLFHRGKELGEEGIEKLRETEVTQRMQDEARQTGLRAAQFKQTFSKELQEGLKDLREKMKKDR